MNTTTKRVRKSAKPVVAASTALSTVVQAHVHAAMDAAKNVVEAAVNTVETIVKKGRATNPDSKAQRANAIFAECYAMESVPQRKDILAKVQAECGLTIHGSATYLHNYRAKNGLVTPKAK